jgi:pyruvate dehydrogenase E2 component (dihydrolipoamide acetyltransferase)
VATKDFLLPDLGEGLTSGEIVSWLVAVGDVVEIDQPIVEVETAKAVVEVPSPFAGSVATLHGEVGQEVEVGKPLVTIDVGGGEPAPARGGHEPGHVPAEAEVGDIVPSTGDSDDGASGSVLVGYGTGGGGRTRRRRAGAGASNARTTPETGPGDGGHRTTGQRTGKPLAKPPVRKLARDLGVDLADVPGSGPDGVVTRDDVEAFAATGAQAPSARPTAAEERIPVKGVRKAVAEKMTVSRREIPEATSWVDVDATPLMELRAQLNASQDEVKVSPLALILRACVAGLLRFPELNARLDTERGEIVLQRFVNLGVATQTDAGLMVPVVHGADGLSTLELAAELNRLAAAARDRKLGPAELTGSTFTVSNYGSFGVDGGNPVINHPEAAILGVGRIADRPWAHDGELAVRKVVQLSVAFDHRICDGGEAAGFLRFVADCIERPGVFLGAL